LYPEVWLSVSVTTRQPRPGEVHGQHYYFLTDAEFDELIANGGLLEWATYSTARYGTPRAELEAQVAQGRAVIVELEMQGARLVRERLDPVRAVFLAPPCWNELERRLRRRGTESEASIQRRLETAREEMEYSAECDHVVVNNEVASAVEELVNLIGLSSLRAQTDT
jgi:guanylate kinase